jgi:hypothetical protein
MKLLPCSRLLFSVSFLPITFGVIRDEKNHVFNLFTLKEELPDLEVPIEVILLRLPKFCVCVCYVSGLSLIVAGTIPLPLRGNYRVVPPQYTFISAGITRPHHLSLYKLP